MFTYEGQTILFSGRQDGIHHGTIAIILDGSASRAISQWMPVSNDLILASFITLHAKVMIIQCYAPPNDHKDAEEDDYYQQLQELVKIILWHDRTIVMGHMNAQIGGDRSGMCLVPTLMENVLTMATTSLTFVPWTSLRLGHLSSSIRISIKSLGYPIITRPPPRLIIWQ